MRKLNGFILSFALVLVAGMASAQQVSVNISGPSGTTTIPPEDIQSISIDPVTSVVSITTNVDYIIELQEPRCTVDCGEVAPTITAFNVASPVTVGDSTTVSWSSTDNATSCTPIGNYAGWTGLNIATDNNGMNVPMNLVGTFNLGLICNNGELASAPIYRTIVVNDVVAPPPPPPPASACDDYVSPLSGTTVPWNEVFAEDFPRPGYANEYMSVDRSGYVAMEFDTENFADTGSLMTVEVTTTSGRRVGSVSQCPGDFDVAPECQYTWGTSGGIIWSTENYAGSCELDPDTTYYFNVTFTDGFDPTSSTCGDARCITKLRVYNP